MNISCNLESFLESSWDSLKCFLEPFDYFLGLFWIFPGTIFPGSMNLLPRVLWKFSGTIYISWNFFLTLPGTWFRELFEYFLGFVEYFLESFLGLFKYFPELFKYFLEPLNISWNYLILPGTIILPGTFFLNISWIFFR